MEVGKLVFTADPGGLPNLRVHLHDAEGRGQLVRGEEDGGEGPEGGGEDAVGEAHGHDGEVGRHAGPGQHRVRGRRHQQRQAQPRHLATVDNMQIQQIEIRYQSCQRAVLLGPSSCLGGLVSKDP